MSARAPKRKESLGTLTLIWREEGDSHFVSRHKKYSHLEFGKSTKLGKRVADILLEEIQIMEAECLEEVNKIKAEKEF